MTKTVLVTGGCGFIGTWVVRRLMAEGSRVVVLDRGAPGWLWNELIGEGGAAPKRVCGSLLDDGLLDETLDRYSVGEVVHLAALLTPACQANPWEGFRLNVEGSLRVFEAIRRRRDRIRGLSYASSVSVFGPDGGVLSVERPGDALPLTFYGAYKRMVEGLAHQYWLHHGVASVGVRPQVVYGYGREVGLTAGPSLAARAAALGESHTIGYVGRTGYDYVEDVAEAFVRAAHVGREGAPVVDLGGETATVEELLDRLGEVVPGSRDRLSAGGATLPAYQPVRPVPIDGLIGDWRPVSLREGLRRTVERYRDGGRGLVSRP